VAEGFRGMDELIAALRNMPEELKGEAAKTITATADAMEADVRQQYARGPTGNLLKGVGQRARSPLNIRVHSRAFHVYLYEYGSYKSGERHHKSGKSTGTMPANPVFVPAAVRARKRMYQRHEEMLRRAKVRGMTGSAA
jgi:hypothetical protein